MVFSIFKLFIFTSTTKNGKTQFKNRSTFQYFTLTEPQLQSDMIKISKKWNQHVFIMFVTKKPFHSLLSRQTEALSCQYFCTSSLQTSKSINSTVFAPISPGSTFLKRICPPPLNTDHHDTRFLFCMIPYDN